MSHKKPIHVTVDYTGQKPWHETVDDNPTFHDIKLNAMHHFDLERSSADKYALQYDGTDLRESHHLDSLGHEKVTLLLTLKEEPVKG